MRGAAVDIYISTVSQTEDPSMGHRRRYFRGTTGQLQSAAATRVAQLGLHGICLLVGRGFDGLFFSFLLQTFGQCYY